MAQSFDVSTQGMTQALNKNEGKATSLIERQTARLPSLAYLGLAIGSIALSAGLMVSARPQRRFGASPRRMELANFVGQWVPSLLVIGVYNKLVKIEEELLASRGTVLR